MLTKLDKNKITHIYNTYMVNDFPPDELKPLGSILKMVDEGLCTCYALYDGEKVLSYFNLCEKDGYVLVDYLAVNPEMRGQGIGGRTLECLKEAAGNNCIIVECEDILKAVNPKEEIIRRRRIAFYQRAGFSLTNIKSRLFGVDYVLLVYPKEASNPAKGYSTVYYAMLGKEMYDKHMEIKQEE